jgi:hypothetical protein
MDEDQYDLVLFLMSDYDLKGRQGALRAAQRVERHRPDGDPAAFNDELVAIAVELSRRAREDEAPF